MPESLFSETLIRYAILGAVFLLTLLVVLAALRFAGDRQGVRRRLEEVGAGSGRSAAAAGDRPATLRSDVTRSRWLALTQRVESLGIPLIDKNDQALRARLVAAGYPAPHAPRVYQVIRLALVVGLPLLFLAYLAATGSRPSLVKLYLAAVIFATVGLYFPSLWIRARAARRQRELVNGFPDALDLMLVCVEAGLGLESAFSRVGMEMTRSHPLLAEQFSATVLELRAGRSHEDALRRLADRAGAEEIRAFATLLVQSTKLGTSIAQTLRIYAAEMRERRRMRAEEKAHRLPVLLSIPLVTCMLPTMIGVLMLPAVIRTVRVLLPALRGQAGG